MTLGLEGNIGPSIPQIQYKSENPMVDAKYLRIMYSSSLAHNMHSRRILNVRNSGPMSPRFGPMTPRTTVPSFLKNMFGRSYKIGLGNRSFAHFTPFFSNIGARSFLLGVKRSR